MKIVMFYHSLLSDWNHGNAHFLRGIAGELLFRGYDVRVYEPRGSWSLQNLRHEFGEAPMTQFKIAYPRLDSTQYDPHEIDLNQTLDDADLVMVHEWNDRNLVHQIGQHRKTRGTYGLLFHDTHHRAVTSANQMEAYDLSQFDGVLAYGQVLRNLYLERGWAKRAWTWHEAADTRLFRPLAERRCEGDLVWIGNWGDEERTEQLREFLLEPIKTLGLSARIYGVRYPAGALDALRDAGVQYGNWLANYRVPEVFARFKLTVHIPRKPYVEALPGIPTIRVFEALACGIPLICSPWSDVEGLFTPGQDYLLAESGHEMAKHMLAIVNEPELARRLAAHGHRTILSRHTCAHRVDELMEIVSELRQETSGRPATQSQATLPPESVRPSVILERSEGSFRDRADRPIDPSSLTMTGGSS